MGKLVTETPHSETNATIELLDRWGVEREDLARFRKSSSYVQMEVVRLMKCGEQRSTPAVDDSLIRIMRPVKPTYPNWVREVMHPELEDVGPGEYDLAQIDPWLHDGQRNGGRVTGNRIYEDFERNDGLKTCLGLRDGEEIQKKGIAVFRRFFAGKALFLWKSVVRSFDGDLVVPYLGEGSGRAHVHEGWIFLERGHGWNGHNPAARFKS